MNKSLAILASSFALAAIAPATTVAHWQFNDLTDSSGNGHTLTDTNTGATISAGSANFINPGGTSGVLSAPNNAAWNDTSFTVEAIFTFTTSTQISTLAAHLDGTLGRQWLLGTTDTNVPMLLLNNGSDSIVSSGFGALLTGHTYYFGAAVDLTAVNPADRVTFYLRDIGDNGAFQQANLSTAVTSLASSTATLSIGSTGHGTSRFVGGIDELRISGTKLGPNDLLIAPIPEPSAAMLSLLTVSLLGLRRKRD